MIQWLSKVSRSFVAQLLMGVLACSFMVWGIADVFTGQSSTALATVGTTEISSTQFSRDYRNLLRNQGQQMGMDLTPEVAQKMGLDQQELQRLISQAAISNVAARMNLTTTDAQLAQTVRDTPGFKDLMGQFNHATFLQALQGAGFTEPQYLEETRADETRNQLLTALEIGFTLPSNYAAGLVQFAAQKRAADYVIVSADAAGPVAPPSDAVLAAYVKAHADKFSTPEYREVEYAQIAPLDVISQVTVSDKMIADEFKAHEDTYNVPEKRDLQQIEFPSEAEAKAARDKINAGTTFEALAAERKITPANLSLGTVTKADLPDQARADAAFTLPANEVSQPVKGAINGYVLLRVTKITPAIVRTLDDVKDQIKQQLGLQLAGAKLTDVINAFEDARSGGADIATAAKKTGMKAGRIAAVDKNGLDPSGAKLADLPPDPEFLQSAFAAEVGEDNDPFPAKSGAYYALKVNGTTPPKLKPLEQVREAALAAWTVEEKAKLIAAKAQALMDQAKKDGNLAGIAKTLKAPVQQSPALGRDTNDTTFSADLIAKLFDVGPRAMVEAAQGTGGNYIIAQLTGISHPQNAATLQLYQQGRVQLSEQAAEDFTIAYANAVRLQQGVTVNQQMLQQATGGNS